jgi:hypothetical protein
VRSSAAVQREASGWEALPLRLRDLVSRARDARPNSFSEALDLVGSLGVVFLILVCVEAYVKRKDFSTVTLCDNTRGVGNVGVGDIRKPSGSCKLLL